MPSPPPITITGVRIPADGTPVHLLSLTTISTTSVSGATGSFLLHVPDLRQYWKTERAWGYRDIRRLDLYSQNPLPQQYHPLQQQHSACIGAYYVFYSFSSDDLPTNSSVPAWIGVGSQCRGDIFLVKMASHEYGQYSWAVYEDIVPEFLDLLVKGPSYCQK